MLEMSTYYYVPLNIKDHGNPEKPFMGAYEEKNLNYKKYPHV